MNSYECKIEDNFIDGVYAISLVSDPAIEENFIYLSNNKFNYTLAKITSDVPEKRIITGPALIPDKLIYRINQETGEEYEIYFTKDTIQKAMELFFKRQFNKNSTLEHEVTIDNVTFFESWMIEDTTKDKSNTFGYKLPVGTWMLSAKIDNEKVWNEIKEGKLRGFSIEAYFTHLFDSTRNELKSPIDMAIDLLVSKDTFDEEDIKLMLKLLQQK